MLLAVEDDLLADNRPVAAELALPEAVAQHDDLLFARHVLVGREAAAEDRRDAERLEHEPRRTRPLEPLGVAAYAGERWRPPAQHEHAVEERRVVSEIPKPGRRRARLEIVE
ncbi:MAG: hypothetical protein K0S86_5181 [Geminicoccaceae bacterium]|nr:hypothetical protein [Geminicoccaceae bacterium]